MDIFTVIIASLWIVLLLYWFISAMSAKRPIRRSHWWQGAAIRVGLVFVILLLLRIPSFHQAFKNMSLFSHFNPIISSLGVFLCVSGIALAIWARVSLGNNWGMPMTQLEKPSLVMTGPYSVIRHPIYSGFLLGVIGTSLVSGLYWLVLFAVVCAYFVYTATVEEHNMLKQFPKEYPQYKKRTRSLIPFIY